MDKYRTTQKVLVGYKAVDDYVKSGMVIGIGSGSTTHYAMHRLSQHINNAKLQDVSVVPSSELIREQCVALKIPYISYDDITSGESTKINIDLMIDGVDEIDTQLNMIKGSSGTFFHEKLMQSIAKTVLIVCDESKLTRKLGPGHPLPIEVSMEDYEKVMTFLEGMPSLTTCRPMIRYGTISNIWMDGLDYAITEEGNIIIDLYFESPIMDAQELCRDLDSIPEILAHGLILYDPKMKLLVSTNKGFKIAGKGADNVWWDDLPIKKALSRKRIDNSVPSDNKRA